VKKLLIILATLMACTTIYAQYAVNSSYELWFEGSDNEITTRKSIACTENYQDLWNGCYVRVLNEGKVYIYSGNRYFLYGDEINLLYNGYYSVKRGRTWYLFDSEGKKINGVYGTEMTYYPFNYIAARKGENLWYVYNCDGEKLNFYSHTVPIICYNSCWVIQQGNTQYGTDPKGNKIRNVHGDKVSLVNGRWKCIKGTHVRYVDN